MIEENPVGAVVVDGRTIAVAGDGTLLSSVSATGLPTIPLKIPPGGSRVTDPTARGAVAILAAAPPRLRESISQVTSVSGHGLVVQVRNGPSLYFGDATRRRREVAGRDRGARRPGIRRRALHRCDRPGAAGGRRRLGERIGQHDKRLTWHHIGRLRLNLSFRSKNWQLSRYDREFRDLQRTLRTRTMR